jgi:hypothetical protein
MTFLAEVYKNLINKHHPLKGIIVAEPCINNLKLGNRVVLSRGLGTIIQLSGNPKSTKVMVEFLGKRTREQQWIDKSSILQFFVKSKSNKYPLAYDCYNYVGLQHNQPVEFSVSAMGFAKLTEKTKEKYAYFVFFNKIQNGRILYSQLKRVVEITPKQR